MQPRKSRTNKKTGIRILIRSTPGVHSKREPLAEWLAATAGAKDGQERPRPAPTAPTATNTRRPRGWDRISQSSPLLTASGWSRARPDDNVDTPIRRHRPRRGLGRRRGTVRRPAPTPGLRRSRGPVRGLVLGGPPDPVHQDGAAKPDELEHGVLDIAMDRGGGCCGRLLLHGRDWHDLPRGEFVPRWWNQRQCATKTN